MQIVQMISDAGLVTPGTASLAAVAYCLINREDERALVGHGLLHPAACGLTGVGCNTAEFYAFLLGLETLARTCPGWSGTVCTDSNVTLQRFFGGWKMGGIPAAWVWRGQQARQQLGELTPVLLGGHPTKSDLEAGVRWSKAPHLPVSRHQVWCDERCTELLLPWRGKGVLPQEGEDWDAHDLTPG